MPELAIQDVQHLVGLHTQAEHELDLRGVTREHAEVAITRMLGRRRFDDPTTVIVRIDPATPDSGETLFLPIGRHLLAARKRGLVSHFNPLPDANGGGFHVTLPGHPTKAPE